MNFRTIKSFTLHQVLGESVGSCELTSMSYLKLDQVPALVLPTLQTVVIELDAVKIIVGDATNKLLSEKRAKQVVILKEK